MADKDDNESVNILLVDDDARNLESLCAILASPEYNLVKAASGEEALAHLLDTTFAVVILDVMMPEMDGFEVARMIKSRKKTADIPIIFLTAYHTDEKDVFQGYTLGAYDYLIKPANPELLRAKVAAFARLFRNTEAIRRQYRHMPAPRRETDAVFGGDERQDNTYRDLLLAHVRAMRQANPLPSRQVEALARELAAAGFDARAVVRLHMRAIEAIVREMSPTATEAFALDARLLLLELMGNLIDIYRVSARDPAEVYGEPKA